MPTWLRWGSPALVRGLEWSFLLVLVAAFCWAWGSSPINLRERIFPTNLVEVERGWLYRSGLIRPNLVEVTLRNLKIDLIVDLTHDLGQRDPRQVAEKRAAEKLGIKILRFPMSGKGIGTVDQYAAAIGAIASAGHEGQHVLVHCAAGDRRSGGVLAAYQILVKGVPPAEARLELERFSTDRGAETALMRFLREHLDEIAQRLVETGVIARVPDPMPEFASR